jgi:hypothetical protein
MQPQRITGNGSKYYDDIDRLAADIAALIKKHDEEFDSEDQIQGCSWRSLAAYAGHAKTTGMRMHPCRVSGFRHGFTRCMDEQNMPGYLAVPSRARDWY